MLHFLRNEYQHMVNISTLFSSEQQHMVLNRYHNAQIGRTLTMALLLLTSTVSDDTNDRKRSNNEEIDKSKKNGIEKFSHKPKLNNAHYLKVLQRFDNEFQASKNILIEFQSRNMYEERRGNIRNKKFTRRRVFSLHVSSTQLLEFDPILQINPTEIPVICDPNIDGCISRQRFLDDAETGGSTLNSNNRLKMIILLQFLLL